MSFDSAEKIVDRLLQSMFCQKHPDRRQYSFMYNRSGGPSYGLGAGFEVHFDNRALMQTALFARRNAAPHLRSLAVSEVESALTDFVVSHFGAIDSDAFDGCMLGAGRTHDAPFSEFISDQSKERLVQAIAASDLLVEPEHLFTFPLVVVRTNVEFDYLSFFIVPPEELTLARLPNGYVEADLNPVSFPPFSRWDGKRHNPASWLGVRGGTLEIGKRYRAAILGAIALLPHRFERYQFSGRALFGGVATFDGQLTMTTGTPHTPALSEDVILSEEDRAWLSILAEKITSDTKEHKRHMRSLEYFYRAWVPDATRRFPTLFASLDAIFGDAGRATQSVIEAVGPQMGEAYDYDRLKLLLSLRGSVIHGGAPNVYESSSYHKYYESYETDAIKDLEIIVATCLRSVIFGTEMSERPHTHADLIKKHTGRDV